MFRAVRKVATEVGVPIHVHVAEGRQEITYIAESYGTTPVRWLDSLGFFAPDVTCAHCTQIDSGDIEILAERGARIATCPVSNAKLCSGTIPLRAVLAAGITVGLATDGPASHNTLDMFQEMKFAGVTHKQQVADPQFLTTTGLLELATTGAAAAMQRPELGRLEPGHPADVVVVDLAPACPARLRRAGCSRVLEPGGRRPLHHRVGHCGRGGQSHGRPGRGRGGSEPPQARDGPATAESWRLDGPWRDDQAREVTRQSGAGRANLRGRP